MSTAGVSQGLLLNFSLRPFVPSSKATFRGLKPLLLLYTCKGHRNVSNGIDGIEKGIVVNGKKI